MCKIKKSNGGVDTYMEYEVEYKLINIKDINKLKRIEEEDSFDDGPRIECETDIADEYCKEVLKKALSLISEDTESKYIGCTERIGHYEFEIKCTSVFYKVVFQQDTYEKNIHMAVKIGYKDTELCNLHITGYDFFIERLKLSIKKVMIQDWEKCIWISDSQSLQLSKEVYSDIYIAENEFRAFAM